MNQDPVKEVAARWFKKLTDPATATYRTIHARRRNSATTFAPEAVLEQYRKTGEQRMERLDAAVKELVDPKKIGN